MAREIRISVPDEVYDGLAQLAAGSHLDAAAYAEQVLTDDVVRARFQAGARDFIADHGDAFAAQFGPATAGGHAA
jgi:hypothetical protein